MAFSDWDFTPLPGSSNWEYYISPLNPIDSTGSLFIAHVTTGSNHVLQANLNNTFTQGITHGRIRTLVRRDDLSGGDSRFSLFCMGSATNLTSSGSFYAVVLSPGTTSNLILIKSNDGLSVGLETPDTTFDTTNADFDVDDTFNGGVIALEFEWNADDQVGLGGTQLIVRLGLMLDFSDLSEVMNEIDSSSPLTSATIEGMAIETDVNGSAYSIDRTFISGLT